MTPPRVAMLLSDLNTGGVQHAFLRIARGLVERGAQVTLLVCEPGGRLETDLPEGAGLRRLEPSLFGRLEALRAAPHLAAAMLRPLVLSTHRSTTVPFLPALAAYLRSERPDTLFTATPFLNLEALLARRLARTRTRVVISERSHFSSGKARQVWRLNHLAPLMRRTYPQADAVVAVSNGVADDIAVHAGLAREAITVLHNPTLVPELPERAAEPLDHPWFREGEPPVVLAIGRPAPQKDFATLIRAFAVVRAKRPARLVILGEAGGTPKRVRRVAALVDLARDLGVADDVRFAGYAANPLPYVKRAAVFALSSLYEGFPNVLMEALACGTSIVSTDCPSGPAEILDGGRYGRLVPVGDAEAMAHALDATLSRPFDPLRLKARAGRYGYERSVEGYARMLLGDAGATDNAAMQRKTL